MHRNLTHCTAAYPEARTSDWQWNSVPLRNHLRKMIGVRVLSLGALLGLSTFPVEAVQATQRSQPQSAKFTFPLNVVVLVISLRFYFNNKTWLTWQ